MTPYQSLANPQVREFTEHENAYLRCMSGETVALAEKTGFQIYCNAGNPSSTEYLIVTDNDCPINNLALVLGVLNNELGVDIGKASEVYTQLDESTVNGNDFRPFTYIRIGLNTT